MLTAERLEQLKSAAEHFLDRGNIDNGDCWNCGGEGYTFDCFDGCCEDADVGCDDCTRRCFECARREYDAKRADRIAILRALDIDLGIGWLVSIGRFDPRISRETVLVNLHAGRTRSPEFSQYERAASACWVEGLIDHVNFSSDDEDVREIAEAK